MTKPFSQACENNKEPILEVLKQVFAEPCEVLEIGSGTGQHAVHFARHLSHVNWQPTDLAEHLPGMVMWLDEAGLENIKTPHPLNVNDDPWPYQKIEAVFTANTLHIMSWRNVEIFFDRLGQYMQAGAKFLSYGPFNVDGTYTSESNARFDNWLKEQDPLSAIRDIGSLITLAEKASMKLLEEITMPSNNKILVWEKD